ncbi:MAG TPA: hypothetical protein VLZ75_07810 [Chitinophagales bacterium]|nr:hypothetical protein [Chitinophagales bacterium]
MFKKITIILNVLVLTVGAAFAQQSDFVVNEIEGTFSQGQQTGLEITIPEVDLKSIQSSLSKWTKSNKGKYVSSKKSTEIFQDNVMLSNVSENTVDMYTILSPNKDGVTLQTYVDLGGTFLSSAGHPQAFQAMEKELIDFARTQLVSKVSDDIKAEEKQLKKLESEFKTLTKNNESYHKDILNNKDNINKQELAIAKNEIDQKTKEQQISLQQQILLSAREKRNVMGATDATAKKMLDGQVKTEEKSLKSFESQLKKLKSDYSSSIKSIEKSRTTIAQREQDIIKNEEEQNTKSQQIDLQKQIIDAVKNKRSNIN